MKKCLLIAILSCTAILSSEANATAYAACIGNPGTTTADAFATMYWVCRSSDKTLVNPWVLGDSTSTTADKNCPVVVNTDCGFSDDSMAKAKANLVPPKSSAVTGSNAQFASCWGNPLGNTHATVSWFCHKNDVVGKPGEWVLSSLQSDQDATCSAPNYYCGYFNLASSAASQKKAQPMMKSVRR